MAGAFVILVAGAFMWTAISMHFLESTALGLHSKVHRGMTYSTLIDLTAKEPTSVAHCEEHTAVQAAPCRLVRISISGAGLASYSFLVTFDDSGVVTGIEVPAYDVW